MAQYFQVLSQPDKPTPEELRQFYPNIVENQTQTIQYVLKPDEQPFQAQQILVSSDRLMVVDGQTQQVIIDQSQVAYQSQQYVFQDAKVEFQDGQTQQPVYYMEESGSHRAEQIQAEQVVQQPIVLNHQLPGTTPITAQETSNSTQKVIVSAQRQNQMSQIQQPIRQPKVPNVVQTAPRGGGSVRGRRPIEVPGLHCSQRPIQEEEITENDNHEAIALDNGTIVTVAQYKQMMVEKNQGLASQMPAIQERLEAPPIVTTPGQSQKRKYNRNMTSRPVRGTRNIRPGRGAVNNVNYSISQENQSQTQPRFSLQQHQPRKVINQRRGNMIRPPIPQIRFMSQQQPQMIMQAQRHIPTQAPHQVQAQQPVPVQQPAPIQPPVPIQQPQYIIQPHSQHHQQQQQQQQGTLPAFVPSTQIQQIIESTPVSEDYIDSIRMLVLLSNGEQRLITFTLPKEQCSIQEILEQVGVPLQPDTKIECTETNTNGINYIVTVGLSQFVKGETTSDESIDLEESNVAGAASVSKPPILDVPAKPSTPEPPKEIPKVIPGRLAVCINCGYLSEDFNKCLRCKRKLPEDVKSVAAADQPAVKKQENAKSLQMLDKKMPTLVNKGSLKPCNNARIKKKERPKLVEPEPIILTLSSDEEEDSANKSSVTTPHKLVESHITLSEVKKEPTLNDIQQSDTELMAQGVKGGGKEDNLPNVETFIFCRTVRIGSYRFVPPDDIIVNSMGLTIKVPMPKDSKEIKTIMVERKHIVKVLVNFQKLLPVIFYYVMPSVGQLIREQLNMANGGEPYFDPLSKEEAYKRITILPEILADETKIVFKQIYGKPCNIMDELTAKEANNILLKTCPKEVTKAISASSSFSEIKQLLIYPPGKGGLPINTEDYLCLAQDQFLNDVIIDFYLKYVVLNLPQEKQDKVHVFSTFFYKRLTTKPLKASRRSHPAELDSSLTPAQKRHSRVKNWTKSVNLFEKDFIIVPINESSHWFLAIICFPGLDGCYTFDGKPVKLEPKVKKKKTLTTTIGNVTITQVKLEKDETINCEDGEASDKDEAEGDDSELDSEEEVEEPAQPNNQPIKQPCILIFDSLAGASRSRVVATLRDYLTCEFKIKMNSERTFNKDLIKCACPKVPQQTNFTDCGLYLLQYVESFFKDPIKDYRIPINELKTWFEELTVTKKREDLSKLIKELMIKYDKDPYVLPEITFPTLNGKLLPRLEDELDEDEEEEGEEEDDEDDTFDELLHDTFMKSDPEDNEMDSSTAENDTEVNRNADTGEIEAKTEESAQSPMKPSSESQDDSFQQTVAVIRPDLSEIKKQSSRDTLSYLKAKRINRHKNTDSSDSKKLKLSSSDF